MAISFASIGSHSSNGRYSLVKTDQLNPADRAYLDECRRGSRNSATGVRCFDGMGLGGGGGGDSSARKCHLQPHPLANGKQSINPYHESFRAAQAQLLQQRIQLKKGGSGSAGRGVRGGFGSGKWTWKRTLLLTAVIAVLVGTFIVIACVKAENYQNGDYVRFFSALIPAILLASLAFVLLSKLAPWIREKRRRQRKDENEAKEAVEVEKSTTEDLETAGEATTTVAEEASSAVMVNWADKKEAEDDGKATTATAAKEIV